MHRAHRDLQNHRSLVGQPKEPRLPRRAIACRVGQFPRTPGGGEL
ncbi:hypothetical protein APASM_0797 [Actinosynnema pretiosum subsp. pretiosum]|nr:hypothetical protein APASM_0797 [Actinosynnema pretiosum subsp. pretiosum]